MELKDLLSGIRIIIKFNEFNNKISFYTKYGLRSASVRERFIRYIPYLKKN